MPRLAEEQDQFSRAPRHMVFTGRNSKMRRQVLGKVSTSILTVCTITAFLTLSDSVGAQNITDANDLWSIIRRRPLIATPPGLPDQRLLSDEAKGSASYTFHVMDLPEAINTFPSGINRRKIVGSYFIGNDGIQHGFVISAQAFMTVDFLGAINSGLSGINKAGHIIGGFVDHSGENSALLNKTLDRYWLIDFPDAFITRAFALNDSSQIVGRYVASRDDIETGIVHAFVSNC